MSHTDTFILEVHDDLRLVYPAIPDELVLTDEQSGDFGIAHFYYLDSQGRAHISFDDDKVPSRSVVAHELWHAAHVNAGGTYFWSPGQPLDWVLLGYWEAMGYATTLADAWLIAIEKGWWGLWPGEQMADAFAKASVGACAGCADLSYFGGSYDDAAMARVDPFFRSLRPQGGSMLTDEDKKWVTDTITHAIAEYGQRLQSELEANAYGPARIERELRVKAGSALKGEV